MNYNKVFSLENLEETCRKCKLGVRWKPSVQRFTHNELTELTLLYEKLRTRTYELGRVQCFDINERGKVRHIQSLQFKDRIVQKCFCDNCLIPLLTPKLIYDNGACLKGKGVQFARDRLKAHLEKYCRQYKNEGYILVFDIKSYFDSIPHDLLKEKVFKYLTDKDLQNLYSDLLTQSCGDKGLSLGSQISQISAIYYLHDLDFFIKQKLHIKYYGRYMDDGYIIFPDKEKLKEFLEQIKEVLAGLKLQLSEKKTRVIKLSKGFTFMKRKYKVLDTGKIIITTSREAKTRERRKLKRMFKAGVPLDAIETSLTSWIASTKGTKSYHAVQNMKNLFNKYKQEYHLKSVNKKITPPVDLTPPNYYEK